MGSTGLLIICCLDVDLVGFFFVFRFGRFYAFFFHPFFRCLFYIVEADNTHSHTQLLLCHPLMSFAGFHPRDMLTLICDHRSHSLYASP